MIVMDLAHERQEAGDIPGGKIACVKQVRKRRPSDYSADPDCGGRIAQRVIRSSAPGS
jgi:hypothetical protein